MVHKSAEALCLLDELLPSGNHCSDVLEGMIAQVLLLAQEVRLEWKAEGWRQDGTSVVVCLLACVCWVICSRAETAIFHWNTSLAVFQSHVSKKQGHNCWYWVENYGSCWFPDFFLGLLCISSSLLCQIVWQRCCWNTADEVCDQTLPLFLE